MFKGVHPTLISILNKCLQYEAQNRYASFFDLGLTIEEYYKATFNIEPHFKFSIEMAPGVWIQTDENSFSQAANLKADIELSAESGKIPPNTILLQRKGHSLMNIGNYKEALDCFEKCIKEFLDHRVEYVNEFAEKSGIEQEKASTEFEKMLVTLYLNKANALQALGHGKESVKLYKEALSIKPEDGDLWYNLAEALFNLLDDTQGAIAAYRKAIKINPLDDMAWASLGVVLSKVGKSEESLGCSDQAIKINPTSVPALANKGVAMLEKNNKTMAFECFQQVLEIEPGNSLAWYYKGKALAKTNPSEALRRFQRAVQLDPNNPYFRMEIDMFKSK